MTIDEAIKHAEEVAEEYESDLKVYENLGKDRELFKKEENNCKERGEQYRQLAEWLKELKQLREQAQESEAEQFARWVATKIFSGMFEDDPVTFAELACRKLAKLGIVEADGDEWKVVEPQESEEEDD